MNNEWPKDEPTKEEFTSFHTSNNSNEDRTTKVKIINHGENLGSGRFSKSVEVVSAVIVDENGKESSPQSFVLKNFTFPHNWDWSKGKPGENALNNFNALKEHGLKTWTTYRLNDSKDAILMTNGNIDGKTLLTANQNTNQVARYLERNPIKKIDNFEQFITDLFNEAKKAEKEKVYLHTDAYGFIVDNSSVNNGGSSLDFLIADMDNIEIGETSSRQYEINLQQAFEALKRIIGTYVVASQAYEYIHQAASYLKEKYGVRLQGF